MTKHGGVTYLFAAMLVVVPLLVAGAGRPLAATSDWTVSGGDSDGTYWSPLTQIDTANVGKLGPAWFFEFDTTRGQEAEPIVIDGVMYVTSAWSKVFALDAATGKQIWAYDPQVPGAEGVRACCDVVNRGVAVQDGKVFVGTIDARLIALDAKTGKVIWDVQTGEKGRGYSITGVPRVIRDKVIIGNGGADFDARGYVTAYDVNSGKQVWRFYTVPGKPGEPDGAASDEILEKLARPTWFGDLYLETGGGATAWNAIQYDRELNRVYIGTGNGSPWNHKIRSQGKGDNLFVASIIALDPDTGRYIWHYQQNPGESWDYNSTQPMILTTVKIDGRDRRVLLHVPKNGFFYVIDRDSGKVISAEKMMPEINWAESIDLVTGRPVENPAARYVDQASVVYPSPVGAHNWQPMARSPVTGLVYVPTIRRGLLFRGAKNFQHTTRGPLNDGLDHEYRPGDPEAFMTKEPYKLVAWDPIAQKERWSVAGGGGGVLATAGGLIFQGGGAITGYFKALRATDGVELWRHRLPNGVLPGPVTYTVKGEQYVAIVTGAGAQWMLYAPKAYASQVGRVVVFKLGGKAKLPDDPPPPPPLNPSTVKWDAAKVAEGASLYQRYCFRCHGFLPMGSNIIPDLRRSGSLQDPALWKAIVIDGVMEEAGMIGWSRFMSDEDAEKIRAYVDDLAQQGAAGETAGPVRMSGQ